MDYTNTLPPVEEGANAVEAINEALAAASPAMAFARDAGGSSGLVWAYLGGWWGDDLIAGDAETLGASTTTYMVIERATGAVSFATSATNWNNTTDYARAYIIVTGTTAVTDWADRRGGPGGAVYGSGSAGSSSSRNTVSALATSGSVAIDYALGDYFTLALAGNVSGLTFDNLPGSGKGATLMVKITQDSTARTVVWPASFKWEGAAPLVSTASGAVDLLAITTFDNGTTWQATLSKGRA